MTDVQWSNEQLPPPKPGMSTGAKLAIGCLLLVLAAGGACVAMVVGGVHKATHFVATVGDGEWVAMKKLTDQLGTDDGAKAAWGENPALAKSYASEDEFLRQVKAMRPLLEPLPAERPSLLTGRLSMSVNEVNGQKHVVMGYRTDAASMMTFTFDNGQLSNLRVDRTTQGPATNVITFDAGAVAPH